VLDILVQGRREKVAVKTFVRKSLKGLRYIPRVIVTDQPGSYGAAEREVFPPIIGRRPPTSRRASVNGSCGASSLQATPNASPLHMGLSRHTFVPDAIG
jgi:transposase-like protein